MKRLTSIFLVLVLVLSLLPVNVLAQEGETVEPEDTTETVEEMTTEELTEETVEETTVEASEETTAETSEEATEETSTETTEPSVEATVEITEAEIELVSETGEELLLDGGETIPVTRAQWISALVITFKMTVEEDNYPDNYYSDISSTDSFYRDIMVAIEFGVIDLGAGLAFEPDAAASREFAAQTLNHCLGFQLEEDTYSFSDTADVSYLTAAQVAVNRGWFVLSDGKFLPTQPITEDEKTAMLADAAAVLAQDVIEEEHENDYRFASDLIIVPDGTEVIFDDNDDLAIADCPVTIQTGDIFVVYTYGFPLAFKAVSVTTESNVTLIETSREGAEDAIDYENCEGSIGIEAEDIVLEGASSYTTVVQDLDEDGLPIDGSEHEILVNVSETELSMDGVGINKEFHFSKTLKLTTGVSTTICCDITNLRLEYKIGKNNYYVAVVGDAVLSNTVSMNLIEIGGMMETLSLGTLRFAGVGKVEMSMEYSLGGEITLAWSGVVTAGFSYSDSAGFRLVSGFQKKGFDISAQAKVKAGLRLSASIDLIACSGDIWASAGVSMRMSAHRYDSGTPTTCVTLAAHLYVSVGASARVKIGRLSKTFSKSYDIYNERNSPIRVYYHYEDDQLVRSCTRGNTDGTHGYYTGSSSRYFNPYDGNSGYYNGSGGWVSVWTYSLDKDDNATITGFKGTARSLSIPKEIDGHKVIAIGSSAFNNNKNLTAVKIPDSVETIGYGAFSGCTKLSTVTLSKSLVSLGDRAFGYCTALKTIEIPASLGKVILGTYNGAGPFYHSGLEDVSFEAGTKTIVANLFDGATALQKIEIPETVTSIGSDAFYNCTALTSVSIPGSVTSIGSSAFYNCTALEKAELFEGLKTLGSYAFSGCTALKTINIPATLAELPSYCFKGCAFESFNIPDTVTGMGTYVFSDCTALATVKLPNCRVNITTGTFQNCSALQSIDLPDTVEKIGYKAFYGCTSLAEIRWNNAAVKNIEGYAFYNCDALTTVNMPQTVTTLGSYCFAECDKLQKLTLSGGIEKIPAYAFYHSPMLESVVIPYGVVTIGEKAFNTSQKLFDITLPRTVTSIGSLAFSYSPKATVYGVAGTYAETWAEANSFSFVDRQVNAKAVTLNKTQMSLNKGSSETLTLTVDPESFTDVVSWKSGNTSVATVSDKGVVKAVGLGEATIKVTVGNVSTSCKVTVVQPVTSVSISRSTLTMEALGTYKLTATANPSTALNREIRWSSSDETVATVSENGLVTALKKGTATITATAQDGSGKTGSCKVTVSNNATIAKTVEEMESSHNYENSLSDIWIYTVTGATRLAVTFDSRTNIEDGFDYLYIYGADGKEVGKYTGTVLAGKTVTVSGDTVKLKLVSDDSGNEWGFKVSSIKESTATRIPGDINGDTEVNITDVMTLLKKVAGVTGVTVTYVDVNGDGREDIADVMTLLKYVAGVTGVTIY